MSLLLLYDASSIAVEWSESQDRAHIGDDLLYRLTHARRTRAHARLGTRLEDLGRRIACAARWNVAHEPRRSIQATLFSAMTLSKRS